MADADMKEANDDIKELRPSQIQKDHSDPTIVKEVISSTIKTHLKKKLIKISYSI